MKTSERHVGQISQPRIIKDYRRVSWRGFVAVLSKALRNIERRVAGAVRTSIEVHCIREVSASFDSIVTDDVSPIKWICRGQTRWFKTVGAGNSIGSAKNRGQGFV